MMDEEKVKYDFIVTSLKVEGRSSTYMIGAGNTLGIFEHLPKGTGDALFYDIYKEGGEVVREYKPIRAVKKIAIKKKDVKEFLGEFANKYAK